MKNRSVLSQFYVSGIVALSAILGTAASLVFIEKILPNMDTTNLEPVLKHGVLWAIAVVLWLPCNLVTAKALRSGKTERVLFEFALYSTLLDYATGVLLQHNKILQPLFFVMAVGGTLTVAYLSSGDSDEDPEYLPKPALHKIYVIAGAFFIFAVMLKTGDYLIPESIAKWNWLAYSTLSSVVEYAGGLILAIWLTKSMSLSKETILSSVAFAPMTLIVIFLFMEVPNLAISGPLGIIENGVIPYIMAATLLKKKFTLGEWGSIVIGICTIFLLFFSFN
jgi:hypothetical protein